MRKHENRQQLSKTELEIVSNVALPDKAIASITHRSIHTITKHWQNIRAKLGMDSKVSIAI